MIVLNTNGTNALIIKDGVIYIDSDGHGLKPITEEIYKAMGFTKDVLEDTQFQQDIQWNRIYNRLQPKSIQNQWSVTETHGVSKAKTKEFAYSVGAEVGANLNDITGKITSNISKKFSTTTAVTEQVSHTATDLFPAKPKEYLYADYRVAVYQKQEVYTVIPGEKLKKAMTNLAKVLGISVENVSTTSFTYSTDELRPIVTPNH
ncbi:hypothetical protein CN602_28200 [Bacillus cereus]|uniref:hypothetical protein n=1 Tax=Bacillus cereus TaxID=1396 RepID=UPI000BEF31B9|nr:hypothetical protein [Bacillus cereus]PEL95619.1 hypothetical protein CN602_28200 [Bacillus cereus]